MVPLLTPEVTAQQAGVGFLDSPSPSGVPETGPFRDGSPLTAAVPPLGAVEDSAQPAASTTAVETETRRVSLTVAQVAAAQRKLRLLEEFRDLVAGGRSADAAITYLRRRGNDVSRASLSRWAKEYSAGGFDGLVDRRRGHSGRRRREMLAAADEVVALRRAYLVTNRTRESGSLPEAFRLAARRGELRPELVAEADARLRDGRGLPDALRRECGISAATVRQHRAPTEAGLEFLDSPGASMWIKDKATGQERFVRVGDVLEADDATINFPVCVPWEMGGCKCSDRYGVKVSRFQWLVAIDRASRFIPGWSYVMRSREAYRAEDITSLFHGLFRQHGVWRRLCLEQGVWKAGQVTAMLEALGIERMTAWSPRGKPFIEGSFNPLWTKLSDLPGQVGRFRGEEERTESVFRSCRDGATDPRQHFPMLSEVLPALERACRERNTETVHSKLYGSWIPEERWQAQQTEAHEARRLRPLPAESAWMFSPVVREWTVRGHEVAGSIEVMEGTSVLYAFGAEWLTEFDGARVRAHFDPAAPAAEATLVLLDNIREHRAGEVLGTAFQTSKAARYARRVLGWGDDPDRGLEVRRAAAASMRSTVRVLLPGGLPGYSRSVIRDGLGRAAAIETAIPTNETAVPSQAPVGDDGQAGPERTGQRSGRSLRRAVNPLAPSTPAEFRRRGSLLAQLAAASRAVDPDPVPSFTSD